MTAIVFEAEFSFPLAEARTRLEASLPQFRWTIAEAAEPLPGSRHEFPARMIVSGTSATQRITAEIAAALRPLAGPCPPHVWHLRIAADAGEEYAARIELLIALALLTAHRGAAHLQLDDGGNWLNPAEAHRALALIEQGQGLGVARLLGTAPARLASAAAPRGPWAPGLDECTLLSVVTLARTIAYPRDELLAVLGQTLPMWRWNANPGADFESRRMIAGSMPGRTATILIEGRGEALPREMCAPPHRRHLRIAIDTGGQLALARRIALVLCSSLVRQHDEDGWCQLDNRGNWLNHVDAGEGLVYPRSVNDIGRFDRDRGRAPEDFDPARSWMPEALPAIDDGLVALYRSIRVTLRPDGSTAPASASSPAPAAVPATYAPAASSSYAPAVRPAAFGQRGGGFGRRVG